MEVEEGIEDGHGGRLEQEDKLDPHLVMIRLTNWWFSEIMMMRIEGAESIVAVDEEGLIHALVLALMTDRE